MPIIDSDLNHILEHTKALWSNLSSKKFFVTGGTGFFGKWLAESFAWANEHLGLDAQMLILSRSPESLIAKYPHFAGLTGINFCRGDIRNFEFPEENFDYIIHAATEASAQLNNDDPLLMMDTVVDGTRRVLQFAQQCSAKRLLLVSSGAVYGKQPPDMMQLREDFTGSPDLCRPTSAYAEAKRVAELLCSIYQSRHGLEVLIGRCFAFVGPYLNLDIHYAVGNFIRDGLAGKTINILGDGTPYRSYLYAADLAIWLWTILLEGQAGRAYNVGSDREISIADLAERVSGQFEQKPEVKIAKKPAPGVRLARYVPSIERAKKELGLKCRIDLDEAIKRTIQFYSESYE